MKKVAITLLCSVMVFPLFAAESKSDAAEVEKKVAELQAKREKVRDTLIRQRRAAIRRDKHAAKLAREILTLNQELSEYLDTMPDIKELNTNLSDIDRRIYNLKRYQASLIEKEKAEKAKK